LNIPLYVYHAYSNRHTIHSKDIAINICTNSLLRNKHIEYTSLQETTFSMYAMYFHVMHAEIFILPRLGQNRTHQMHDNTAFASRLIVTFALE
jgi:hypothetical protein